MSNFNPRDPIADPSVFSPRGMYIDNRTGNSDDVKDDEKTFILNASDMKALDRFLGTGRRLPTTREAYLRSLAIADESKGFSDDLTKEVDILVRTYSSIHKDCVQFKDVTWIKILDLAGDIKTYATLSGGELETSYSVLMLQSIKQYHDEKETADEARLAELKAIIQFVVGDELKQLDRLQAGAAEVLTGLGDFDRVCEAHNEALHANKLSLERQLSEDGNDIREIQATIEQSTARISVLQKEIDRKNESIIKASMYIWVGIIGLVVGTTRLVQAKLEKDRMVAEMRELQRALSKAKAAELIVTNMGFIETQVKGLADQIVPAMMTLRKLQGAWKSMETDLKGIQVLVERQADAIPPMIMTEMQLRTIVSRWNELKDYATAFIEVAYINDIPTSSTMNEYINELEAAVKTIEAMQEEEVKG